MDLERIKDAVREILIAIGEDPDREGLKGTPRRVAEMYQEVFKGMHTDPREELNVLFSENHEEMVVVRDITFHSMCEHHLLPFRGKIHVAYVPKGKVVGISKLARVTEAFTRRPQLQERLTSQIADAINQTLQPHGVAVVCEAEHTCMAMRGVQKPGSIIVTSAMRGSFIRNEAQRIEVLNLMRGGSQGRL